MVKDFKRYRKELDKEQTPLATKLKNGGFLYLGNEV
jgi:hypothetical protein